MRCQAPDRAAAVDRNRHLPIRVQYESGGVQETLLRLVERAGGAREFARINAVAYRERQVVSLDGLLCLVDRIDGEAYNLRVQ